MYFLCLRGLNWCMILGKNSLPEPLSPKISTERSTGATLTARSTARSNSGEVPMMPKRRFTSLSSSLLRSAAAVWESGFIYLILASW